MRPRDVGSHGRRTRRPHGHPQRFSLVTLGVADVEAATAFYRRLGLAAVAPHSGRRHHVLRHARRRSSPSGRAAELAVDGGAGDRSGCRRSAPAFRGVSLSINFDSRDEVDAARREWAAAGGEVSKPAEETEWGGYSGYGRDPDGNLWEFAHNPFWPLDERGMPQLDGGEVD